MKILDEIESWLDQHYLHLVQQFRNGDTAAGTKALATMDVRIKLAQIIESALEAESLAGVAENNHGNG